VRAQAACNRQEHGAGQQHAPLHKLSHELSQPLHRIANPSLDSTNRLPNAGPLH
jgi:hypothetical protein